MRQMVARAELITDSLKRFSHVWNEYKPCQMIGQVLKTQILTRSCQNWNNGLEFLSCHSPSRFVYIQMRAEFICLWVFAFMGAHGIVHVIFLSNTPSNHSSLSTWFTLTLTSTSCHDRIIFYQIPWVVSLFININSLLHLLPKSYRFLIKSERNFWWKCF